MTCARSIGGLLAVASLAMAMPARAQDIPAQDAAAMRAEIEALRTRLEALESRLANAQGATPTPPERGAPPAQMAATTPPASAPKSADDKPALKVEWKGSPQFSESGRSFKVKGRIQADANVVDAPGASTDKAFGFSNEFRRIRLGGEGSLGSGIGYKLELELSDSSVDLVDTYITYTTGKWLLRLGNQNTFQSLDELTGDTSGSVMERAAFTDAFAFERRLGLGVEYLDGALLAQAGVFTDDPASLANANDGVNGGDEDNSFGVDGRLVYAPKLGDTQLHIGASAHLRELKRLEEAGVRYRQRPYIHSVNTRVLATPSIIASRETSYGIELAAIHGRWHGAAEYYWLRAARPGLDDPTFTGGYAEIGYFLTPGDTRPYARGIFGGTKPAHPIDKGGIGSIQLNLRYDYLDLNSRGIRGGTQNGYIAALVWSPIQYLRFNVNYAYLSLTDAIPLADGDRDYDLDVVGTRFELDF